MSLDREARSLQSADSQRRLPGSFTRRLLSWALLATGAILLLYTGSQYGRMYFGQQQMETQWWKQQAASSTPPGESNLAGETVLTRLLIPKISLDAIVAEGTSREQLLKGPGHLEKTALPGEPGNAVIAGHRDTFFRHIFELKPGDEILVQRRGRAFRYEVTGKKIIQPEDTSVIAPSSDAELTLITCYPPHYIGPAPERLVVVARLTQ
jgi:LPXTG-site transpeptidase (sortase) family protein